MAGQRIAAWFGADIVSVTGTVNGADAVWQRQNQTLWTTTVPQSQEGVYRIEITAWDELGRSQTSVQTVRYGFRLITDRTEEDVQEVQTLATLGWSNMREAERAKWASCLKGAYNAEDLNRVGDAVAYVTDELKQAGYLVNTAPRNDWVVGMIPTPDEMELYLQNVRILRGMVPVLPNTPEVPADMDDLTWEEANDIEKILFDVHVILDLIRRAWYFSGELFAGEV